MQVPGHLKYVVLTLFNSLVTTMVCKKSAAHFISNLNTALPRSSLMITLGLLNGVIGSARNPSTRSCLGSLKSPKLDGTLTVAGSEGAKTASPKNGLFLSNFQTLGMGAGVFDYRSRGLA